MFMMGRFEHNAIHSSVVHVVSYNGDERGRGRMVYACGLGCWIQKRKNERNCMKLADFEWKRKQKVCRQELEFRIARQFRLLILIET